MNNKIVVPEYKIPGFEIDLTSLPDWANWVAVDFSGAVYAYEMEPVFDKDNSEDDVWANQGVSEYSKILEAKPRPDWLSLKFKIER